MFNPDQVAAGRAIQTALKRAERTHPNSLALHRLHAALAELRDQCRGEMSDETFVLFGGGTPKTDEPEGPAGGG